MEATIANQNPPETESEHHDHEFVAEASVVTETIDGSSFGAHNKQTRVTRWLLYCGVCGATKFVADKELVG